MENNLNNIAEDAMHLKDISNAKLAESLLKLSTDFDEIKNKIISLTYELDTIESLYNKVNKELEKRYTGK